MTPTESQPNNLEDPLVNLTGLSLFRSSLPDRPHNNNHEDSNKLLEQAKKIVDGGSDFLNPDVASDVVSRNKGEVLANKDNARHRERRVELGRKRGSFSLVTDARKSTDTASLLMKFDPDKYTEPEEYFAALDKIEKANKEIQKQTGAVLADQYQNNIPRRRRQGSLRRQVHYRHLYPLLMPETGILGSSQEMPTADGSHSSYASSQSKQENNQSSNARKDTDVAASEEDNTQNILDELLPQCGEDVDDDKALTLLQERLQLKPVNIENLGLPDFRHVRRSDLNATGGKTLKRRSILPDRPSLFKRKTAVNYRQEAESASHNAASPASIESPLAPISILYRRLSQISPTNDPFSSKHIDQAPTSTFPVVQEFAKQSEQVAIEVVGGIVGKSASNLTPAERVMEHDTSHKDINGNSAGLAVGSSSYGCQADLGTDTRVDDLDVSLKNADSERLAADQNDRSTGCTEAHKGAASSLPGFSVSEPNVAEFGVTEFQTDQANVSTADNNAMNGVPENQQSCQEQILKSTETEEQVETNCSHENSGAGHPVKNFDAMAKSKNKQGKTRNYAGKMHKTKENSRRQSLAGLGTSWKGGVRRSTRNRTRPLEYWRGEKLLYGRVHATLATVIGVKYVNPSVEVKSYISDTYKDLLEKAALH